MRGSLLVPVVAAALSLAAGCSATADAPPPGQSRAAVIKGVLDNPAKYDATVSLYMLIDEATGRGAGCTGTLITPHVVVTARHCVTEVDGRGRLGQDYPAEKIFVWYGALPSGPPANGVAKVVFPPGIRDLTNSDIALLVLSRSAKGIPYAPIRLAKPPVAREVVAVAGYGLTENDTGPRADLAKRHRREDLQIAQVGPSQWLGAKEIALGESICQGDSGGPVFAQETGALLAVTSRGGNGQRPTESQPYLGCVGSRASNIFIRVDGWSDLIRKAVADVGEIVWEEGSPKPEQPDIPDPDTGAPPPPPPPPPRGTGKVGTACGGSADCASALCLAVDGQKICSQACSPAAFCPEGFDCDGGYCLPPAAAPATPKPAKEPPAETPAAEAAAGSEGGGGGCSAAPHGNGSPLAGLAIAIALALSTRRARRS
jgi:V8-like Glu-specific endopeptidase